MRICELERCILQKRIDDAYDIVLKLDTLADLMNSDLTRDELWAMTSGLKHIAKNYIDRINELTR